ncbi:MAG: zeta toxin family protein [Ginsengibacter sp.]
MIKPQLIFVVGCNAAGKSTFIRSRLNELTGFEIIMADVYKGRTNELFLRSFKKKKNIIVETVFNDESYKNMVDIAKNAGYQTSLVVLFLDNVEESNQRVAIRSLQQSGLNISGSNVTINFNESFKNVANYYFYFDTSDFIYTGRGGENLNIMQFKKGNLIFYKRNNLQYPQKFAQFGSSNRRLNEDANQIITNNVDYSFLA